MRLHVRLLTVAAIAMAPSLSSAVESGPVAAVDNIPPAPVTDLRALNTGNGVLVTWTPSADDAVSFTTFGTAIVPRGGVNGYNVYRQTQGAELPELIAVAGPGTVEFNDTGAVTGTTYIYSVKPFDTDNETDPEIEPGSAADLARIISLGGAPPDVVVKKRVKSTMRFDAILDIADEAAVNAFKSDFITLLANLLGIRPDRISITSVTQGSIVVDFELLDVEDAGDEPDAESALTNLLTIVADDTANEFESIGPVLDIEDNTTTDTVVIPLPVDADGNVIVGWFTRIGTQVGFDDFFAFADNFGKRDTDAAFDARFDIVPSGVVDFDDFFLFADNFGKSVANAAEIQALLQQ